MKKKIAVLTLSAALSLSLVGAPVIGGISASADDTLPAYVVTVEAPEKVTITSSSKTFDAIRINWEQTDCDGYEVLIKYDGEWHSLGYTKKTTKRVKELKKGKLYVFRVRAFRRADGKKVFGKKSDAKKVRTYGHMYKKNGITYIDGIMIANKTYRLPTDYDPGGLTEKTLKAYNKMKRAANNKGLYIDIISGYRSYSTQEYLYNSYVARDGQAGADRYAARPGYSEHQTGMAVDINTASAYFTGTPAAIWLAKNSWRYGFILRYPEGKEDITGYNYESWHFRYVGKTLAKKLYKSGLTVEEYYGITSQYDEN